jgi:hypothetical protein
MPKRKSVEEKLKELEDDIKEVALEENEEFISRDDIEIEVVVDAASNDVFVKFSGFEDDEDAEEYAQFLAETLPLLLFETTRLQ